MSSSVGSCSELLESEQTRAWVEQAHPATRHVLDNQVNQDSDAEGQAPVGCSTQPLQHSTAALVAGGHRASYAASWE